jgi:hypothetical protein
MYKHPAWHRSKVTFLTFLFTLISFLMFCILVKLIFHSVKEIYVLLCLNQIYFTFYGWKLQSENDEYNQSLLYLLATLHCLLLFLLTKHMSTDLSITQLAWTIIALFIPSFCYHFLFLFFLMKMSSHALRSLPMRVLLRLMPQLGASHHLNQKGS